MTMNHRLSAAARAVTIFLLSLSALCAHAEKSERDVVVLKKNTKIEQARNARVIQLDKSATTAQVLQLRDEQILETKGGRRITVGNYRRIQDLFASARSKSSFRHELSVPIFPAAKGSGLPLKPGETPQQILSRPDKEAIRLPSGRVVSSKQMKAIAPYVERMYGVDLHSSGPALNGRAVKIKHPKDLKSLKDAPDSTILESHKGTRTTLGAVRRALGASTATTPHSLQMTPAVAQ
jgi:hypothetical protein